MIEKPTQTAPKHLKPKTRAWVESVLERWVLEEHHRTLLIMAAESLDRSNAARAIIDQKGPTYLDRFGQPKPRPEVTIERDAKATFARLLRELDLDLETPASSARPPALRSIRGGK
jgi:phage terminase small subunit